MSPSVEVAPGVANSPTQEDSERGEDPVEEQIKKPGPHDVLLGRGGGTNNHIGNVQFRKLVNEHKIRYFACSKVEKPNVAREVVQLWRKMEPPGRFLARVDESAKGPGSVKDKNNVWYEVGDKRAREKASQCLRERTPDVMPYLKQIREQQDARTEQGVSMFQQNMERHQQQDVQPLQRSPPPTSYPRVSYDQHHHASPVGPPPFPSNMHPSYGNMSPSPRGGRPSPMQMRPEGDHIGMAHGGGQHGSPHPAPPPFARRTSCPTVPHGPPQPSNYESQRRSSLPPSSDPVEQQHDPRYYNVGRGDPAVADRYMQEEREYQHRLMVMQRQMHEQQLQLQQLQEERMRAGMGAGMSPHGSRQAYSMPRSPYGQQQEKDEFAPLPVQDDLLLKMDKKQGNENTKNAAVPQRHSTSEEPQKARPKRTRSTRSREGGLTRASVSSKDIERRRESGSAVPDEAPSSSAAAAAAPASASSNDGAAVSNVTNDILNNPEGEMTIEQYRRQLEEYMNNNQLLDNNDTAAGLLDDEDDSDLEDDWEKEKEKAYRQQRSNANTKGDRGVNRTISGCSFMSTDTFKSTGLFSNMSMLSGTSDSCGVREKMMNMARSVSSNLSLMSELTNISDTMEELKL